MVSHIRRRVFLGGLGAAGATLVSRRIRAQGSGPIRIGFVTPLSGPAASVGLPVRLGAEAARNYLNNNGGVLGRQIELVEVDDKGNPNESIAVVRQFAAEGVNLIVGPTLTGTMLATCGLMPDLKAVSISTGTPDERFSHELFNRNIFTTAQNGYTRQHAIASVMAQRFSDVTTWTGAHPDNAAGHDGWASFARAVKDMYPKIAKREVTIVDPILAKYGSTDFKVQISNLMNSPATGFWTNLFGNDGITFYQQAQTFGLSKKFKVMVDYGIDIDLPKTLKRNVPTNVWTSSYWYYGAYKDNPLAAEVLRVFTAAGDPYPHGFAASGSVPVMAYAAAIKAAGSTETDKVIAAMEGLKFDTIRGPSYYRKEDHQNVAHQNLVRWEATDAEPGWKMAEFVTIDDEPIINPPAPGTKWEN